MDASQRDLLLKILVKVLRLDTESKTDGGLRHRHKKGSDCWDCRKDKIRFYYGLVMLPLLCAGAIGTIFYVKSSVVIGGAALALLETLRAITRHMIR